MEANHRPKRRQLVPVRPAAAKLGAWQTWAVRGGGINNVLVAFSHKEAAQSAARGGERAELQEGGWGVGAD
jgi:hypothetical protein